MVTRCPTSTTTTACPSPRPLDQLLLPAGQAKRPIANSPPRCPPRRSRRRCARRDRPPRPSRRPRRAPFCLRAARHPASAGRPSCAHRPMAASTPDAAKRCRRSKYSTWRLYIRPCSKRYSQTLRRVTLRSCRSPTRRRCRDGTVVAIDAIRYIRSRPSAAVSARVEVVRQPAGSGERESTGTGAVGRCG